jgi:cytochrome c5
LRARIAATLALAGVATLAIAAAPGSPAAGAAPNPAAVSFEVLPAGKDRNLVIQTCAVCHPIELVVAKKRSDEDWEKQMARMVGFGAKADEADQDRILDYLEGWFSSERQPP